MSNPLEPRYPDQSRTAQEALRRAQSATAGAKAVLPVAIKTMADLKEHTAVFVSLLREYAATLGE